MSRWFPKCFAFTQATEDIFNDADTGEMQQLAASKVEEHSFCSFREWPTWEVSLQTPDTPD